MKFFTGIFALAVALLVFAPPALASEVSVQFLEKATGNEYGTQVNPVQICPGPLTVREADIRVSNIGPGTDTYGFSLQDMPAGWTGQIQPDVMLASGESMSLSLFVVNTFYTEPGTYFFTIKAVSGTDPGYVIPPKRVQVEILPCYSLELTAEQPSKEACIEKDEEVSYVLSLRNAGKSADTFDISAPSPAKLSTESAALEPGQSAAFTVTLPVSGLQGGQAVRVSARGRTTRASAEARLELDVKDCYSSEAALEPASQAGCIGKDALFKLTLKNTGKGDAYELSLPAWATADAARFSLDRDAVKEVAITAGPQSQGRLTLDVLIRAANDRPEKKVSAVLDAAECRDIVVITSPAGSTVCRGDIAAFDVTVKNRGVLEDTVTVSASAGSLNLNKLTLAAGQSQTLQLNVDTSAMNAGKNVIEITASDGKVSDKSSVDVNAENCYASMTEIVPENNSVCPFSRFNYTIRVTNTGKQPDSYTVKFKDISESASLASGQSASWDIPVYAEQSGVYSLTVATESNNSKSAATAVLVVQPAGKCFAVEVSSPEQSTRVKVNEAKATGIIVKNTGTVAGEYAMSVEGPSWAYVSPDKVMLEPGVQADVYLYISPPIEADNKSVKITVNAVSNHAAGSATVTALVGNASLPEGGVSVNPLTGAVVYDEGDMPFWKVAAIAIIALAIVLILIVRFVLLVKG